MADSALHVIVLAAGEGKRMRSKQPKMLMPLAGSPMLAHVLALARRLQPARIHVVYGHRGREVRAAVTDLADLDWVEQAQQLGTGHAVMQALPQIPDAARVLILYGDVPLIRVATLSALLAIDAPLAALITRLRDPSGYGRVLRDADGRIRSIVEDRDCSPAERAISWINSGILTANAARLRAWIARLTSANAQGEFYLTDIFDVASAAGEPAAACECGDPNEVLGANDAWQLATLERIWQRRRAMELAMAGVRFADPGRFDARGEIVVGRDVSIDVDVILEGLVELQDDVHVGPYCHIRNSTLAAGTVLRSHCNLDGVITHGPCEIGPFARLRSGTELAAGVRVGNFVELKQTSIGRNSQVNHLSYLGDTSLGADANIGAGTITCNYDGAEKHRTIIEDGAFIGSNSALVAPVRIGCNSTIGAGSVIVSDAPEGELTLARARQQTVAGWRRKRAR